MNRTYRFHPADYAIGETEKFYEDMAAKGWQLVKRGLYLSRFEKAEPEKRRYRVELSTTSAFDGTELPEEQIALYEECGWQFVTGASVINVFTAAEGSDAPEIYQDSTQQADTMKQLRRIYRGGWVIALIMVVLDVLAVLGIAGLLDWKLAMDIRKAWIIGTGLVLLVMLLYNQSAFRLLYAEYRIARLYRQMKKGQPLDHSPNKKHWPHRIASSLMWAAIGVAGVISLYQLVSSEHYLLPTEKEGPYLVLADFGVEGERKGMFRSVEECNRVEVSQSLICKVWDVRECVEDVMLYQDIYEFKDRETAYRYLETIVTDSTFADSLDDYQLVELEGLDLAYAGRVDYIAVKENYIYFFTLADKKIISPLEVLASKS
ncbi:MAG: DUF2812 domain-containing protein [Firmicutes bacterium]|nr:DUF2812 domain-containing protein [Bacillota bacterium]